MLRPSSVISLLQNIERHKRDSAFCQGFWSSRDRPFLIRVTTFYRVQGSGEITALLLKPFIKLRSLFYLKGLCLWIVAVVTHSITFVARTLMKGNTIIAKMHEKGEGSSLVPTTGDAEEVRLAIHNELIVKNNTIF